jgi:hypothetical protein
LDGAVDDRARVGAGFEIEDEALVDLALAGAQPSGARRARVAGAEVVDRMLTPRALSFSTARIAFDASSIATDSMIAQVKSAA